jgi:DNA-binding NarL/FixJ family response regulator
MNFIGSGPWPNHDPATVLIADDDARVRHALRTLIETDPHISVAGEASTCSEVVAYDNSLHPTVILLDLVLPQSEDGLNVLRVLAQSGTRRVVAMSLRGELRTDAMAAGACAFIEKGLSPELLLETLASACDG